MRIKVLIIFFLTSLTAFAQDKPYAVKVVDRLASTEMWGRGYTKNGLQKASEFIEKEFASMGLQPLNGTGFLQEFSYPVNTFPGAVEVTLNGKKLEPGVDFIVGPESRGVKSKGKLFQKDSTLFIDVENRVIVSLEKKLTWSVAQKPADYTSIIIDKNRINETPSSIQVNIVNKPVSAFKTNNVAAYVKGTYMPDSFIVITAHYDHLGGMGKNTYFPGANDNASGVALLLDLAKYYAKNPQPYSMAFICFSGEEAGLLGSKYFTDNPLIPLDKIRFLTNVDIAGTGEDGIAVVNATVFSKEFALFEQINSRESYMSKIKSRGKAANSDHYWFSEKGVPAFFIYTMGGIQAYHDVFDKAETLPLNKYEELFQLMVKFNAALVKRSPVMAE